MAFGEFAQSVNERADPTAEPDADYVGLEHLDPQCLQIRRWGKGSDVTGAKLRFRKGDIIFGRRRAYQRKLAVAEFDGICSAHAMVVRAKVDKILPEFLPFLMSSDRFMNRAVEISVGSLSPTINWKTLKLEEFDLPPLEIQRRIAGILWATDVVAVAWRCAEEAIQPFEEALLKSEFGALQARNGSTKLSDLATLITSGSRGWARFYSKAGAVFLRSQNVRDQVLDLTDLQRVNQPEGGESARTQVEPGDLLITATGFSVGNVAYVPQAFEKAYMRRTPESGPGAKL